MPLILNDDGTIYADIPDENIPENILMVEFNAMYSEMHKFWLEHMQGKDGYYVDIQNDRGEASNSQQPIPQEAQAGRSDTCIDRRTASGKSAKALPMGTPVGIGRRVEEETS